MIVIPMFWNMGVNYSTKSFPFSFHGGFKTKEFLGNIKENLREPTIVFRFLLYYYHIEFFLRAFGLKGNLSVRPSACLWFVVGACEIPKRLIRFFVVFFYLGSFFSLLWLLTPAFLVWAVLSLLFWLFVVSINLVCCLPFSRSVGTKCCFWVSDVVLRCVIKTWMRITGEWVIAQW